MGGGASKTYDRQYADASSKTFDPEDVIGFPPGTPGAVCYRVNLTASIPAIWLLKTPLYHVADICLCRDRLAI